MWYLKNQCDSTVRAGRVRVLRIFLTFVDYAWLSLMKRAVTQH